MPHAYGALPGAGMILAGQNVACFRCMHPVTTRPSRDEAVAGTTLPPTYETHAKPVKPLTVEVHNFDKGLDGMGGRPVATCVPLEVALYFGWWYDVLFSTLSLGTSIYKGWNLPYSQGLFGMELTFMVLFVAVEFPRLKLGSSGNKAEKLFHLVLMLAISTAVLLFLAYYTSWQVFVLRIDQILGGIAMGLVVLQMLLALLPIIRILRLPS